MVREVNDVAAAFHTKPCRHKAHAVRNDVAGDVAGPHESKQHAGHGHDVDYSQESEVNRHGDQHCQENADEREPSRGEDLLLDEAMPGCLGGETHRKPSFTCLALVRCAFPSP